MGHRPGNWHRSLCRPLRLLVPELAGGSAVAESALPMSKSALDRLGAHLAAGDEVSDADLANLALVVDAYQLVLDQVKAELTRLGYDATTRVKTTGTLVDKLRREHRMRLSQVQDLAGARIIVSDRPAQDQAAALIRAHFEAAGHSCKEVDRREEPSHGYRALHLVVSVSSVLVEIQVRTDLEDTWAQIVERLADRWGRGIRYGQDPVNPEARVWAGERAFTRRQAMEYLSTLSGVISEFEVNRAAFTLMARVAEGITQLLPYVALLPQARDPRPIAELPQDDQAAAGIVAAGLSLVASSEVPSPDPLTTTLAGIFEAIGTGLAANRAETATILSQMREHEADLRDTLNLIASAADDEGER